MMQAAARRPRSRSVPESHFPPRFRDVLFILDWAYGRIIALDLIPRGASYVCRSHTFLRGRPLNVTDLAFGPDGAMYFITGGRGTSRRCSG